MIAGIHWSREFMFAWPLTISLLTPGLPMPQRAEPYGDAVRIIVDRDSVAMGDDVESHRREFDFAATTTLGDLLIAIRPDASIAGGRATWLVVVGDPVGVYAQEWGATKFFGSPDVRVDKCAPAPSTQPGELTEAALSIRFRYLAQVDPQIVFNRYRGGGSLSATERSQLSAQRIAQLTEADAIRAERESAARYFSPATVAALENFGCTVRIHSARYFSCAYQLGDRLQDLIVQASDTMAGVSVDGQHLAFFRPVLHAEQFVVVQVGDSWRTGMGRPPVALPAPEPGLAVSALISGTRWFVKYNQGPVRHSATFGIHQDLATRFAGYAPLPLSTIIAAYQA